MGSLGAIEVVECEGADMFDTVIEKFNERFRTIKEKNPRGYLDQFGSQYELIAYDIAEELGGTLEVKDDGLKFDFARYGCPYRGNADG